MQRFYAVFTLLFFNKFSEFRWSQNFLKFRQFQNFFEQNYFKIQQILTKVIKNTQKKLWARYVLICGGEISKISEQNCIPGMFLYSPKSFF